MYAYIQGTVAWVEDGRVVLDNAGIGYSISISQSTAACIREGEKLRVFTLPIYREDDMTLYGFLSQEEKAAFQLLTKVKSVGPQAAFSILSILTHEQVYAAIARQDVEAFVQAPGVGKKIAARILLELADNVPKEAAIEPGVQETFEGFAKDEDALLALMNLGFSRTEAQKALKKVKEPGMSLEELMKKALRELA